MWRKVDDAFYRHPKTRKAARLCAQSLGLWVVTISACPDQAEGVVSADLLEDCGHDACLAPVILKKAAAALVTAGLWHDHRTIKRCDRCVKAVGKLPTGAHYFHDWLDYQMTKDEAKIPEERFKRMLHKRLSRNQELRQQIADRDQDRCRYCGILVDFRDRVGPTGGTHDFLDPAARELTLDGIVTACRQHNGEKGRRTHLEWEAAGGLALLPAPGPDLAGDRPWAVHTRTSRATHDGTGSGQAQDGTAPGPGQMLEPPDEDRSPDA